ncbi:ribosome small subunit-dependent GTPase A [Liquorilactobacillus oeni]|nr:ribosome small subunit-dependent GTPase A [Liquorilactobacillus oeni]
MTVGQIHQSLSGYYDVKTQSKVYRTRARGNFRKKNQTPLVGDWVEFKVSDQTEGYILKIMKRKNRLVRPPVANVDFAIIVTAAKEPDFSTNLLDRQLVMLEKNLIRPILYFSKIDLLNSAELSKLKIIAAAYKPYYNCILSLDPKPEEFLGTVENQLGVVMGQTGAGKSTLLNRLKPGLDLKTGEISKALSRGKHTTRKTSLFSLLNNLIADTPGFSSFELADITKEKLGSFFPEFRDRSMECRFRSCLHLNEPGCAVKEAVEKSLILKSRYLNYMQFQKEISAQKPKYRK